MSKFKIEINVNLPQLLCIVVSVALNGKFERFGGFCVGCYYINEKAIFLEEHYLFRILTGEK